MQVNDKVLLAQELTRTISQFWRVGRQKGTYHGIKQSEFMLLVTLIHSTDSDSTGVRVSDLSTKLGITSPGITHMINSLEELGYVERLADKSDRRVVRSKPTPKGLELFRRAHEEHNRQLQGLVEFLGEKDTKELVRLLTLMFTYAKENWHQEEEKPDCCS